MFYEKSCFKSIRKINRKTLKQQVFSCEFCGIFKSSFLCRASIGEYFLKKWKHYHFTVTALLTAWKVSRCRVIYGLYFPVFGLNTEIYGVNLSSQSEYRKIRTRNNSVLGHFSRSDWNCNPDQNIWNKANKSSKIGQDKKTLISAFAQLFNHYCQSFVFRR